MSYLFIEDKSMTSWSVYSHMRHRSKLAELKTQVLLRHRICNSREIKFSFMCALIPNKYYWCLHNNKVIYNNNKLHLINRLIIWQTKQIFSFVFLEIFCKNVWHLHLFDNLEFFNSGTKTKREVLISDEIGCKQAQQNNLKYNYTFWRVVIYINNNQYQ